MLSTVDLTVRLFLKNPSPQSVARIGRLTSAAFIAAAVACLTLLAAHLGGKWAAAWTGFFAATHWNLFELAHYFKEDPALTFGLAATFLAIARYRHRPAPAAAALLGIAVALAASGKYIGLVALPIALPAFFLPVSPARRPPFQFQSFTAGDTQAPLSLEGAERGRGGIAEPAQQRGAAAAPARPPLLHLLPFLLALLTVTVAVNYQAVTHHAELAATFSEEIQKATSSRVTGEIEKVPHFGFFKRFVRVTRAHLAPFVLIYLWVFLSHRRWRHSYAESVVALFPFLLASILAFSLKDSGRYYLPGTLCITFMAGMGAAAILAWVRRDLPGISPAWKRLALQVLIALIAVAGIAGSLERFHRYWRGFRDDSRAQLAAHIRENLSGQSTILQSPCVHLPAADHPHDNTAFLDRLPQTVLTPADPSSLGSLEDLRRQGITHVALADYDYRAYTSANKTPRPDFADRFNRRRDFYKAILRHAHLIWQSPADKVGTHHPPLKLYALDAPQ